MTPEEFAGRGLDPLVDELKLIQRQIEVQPRVSWAYVVGLNPLRVRLERDDFPLLGRAQTLVHESMLEVGDRVEVIIQNGRAIVQGKGGGAMPVDGRLGLVLSNAANQSFAVGNFRAVFSTIERDDGFDLIYSGSDVVAFRPPQDGWYLATGAVMRQSSGTFTLLYGLATHPVASNNNDYLAGGYFAGTGFFLIDFAEPVYLYKNQEYCAKASSSAAWTSQPTAGSTTYHTRLSVISIDSDAIGIPGPQGPAGPPGPPGGTGGAGYNLIAKEVFTANGTFYKSVYPLAVAYKVTAVGGGGAGGGAVAASSGSNSFGQGGGGGGYAESFITDLSSVPSSVVVTVGAGGAATSSTGGSGGTSSFGSLVEAGGGGGGWTKPNSVYPAYVPGGAGGSGLVGDLLIRGQGGGCGSGNGSLCAGGSGGSSQMGGGAASRGTGAGAGGEFGEIGGNYGGGGGGSTANGSAPAKVGGAGAPGIVIVEVFG